MVASKLVRILLLLLLTAVMVKCVEPYEPEVVDYESTLAVDGFYNNGDRPSTVRLSRSYGYQETIPDYIDNAQVLIEDDQGNTFTLLPMGDGLYQTDPLIHQGEVGRSYRLLIDISGGDSYISDWQLMLASPSIGETEIEYQEREQDDPTLRVQKGVQIILSTEDMDREVGFYKWEFEETYEYNVRFSPNIDVVFGKDSGGGKDSVILIPASLQQGPVCYKYENSKNILIASSEGFQENKISKFPLAYISNESSRLYLRYSMLIKQFSISKEYYENLRKVAEVNQTSGSLFDPIPNEIFGNVKNVDNEREPVLGYFGVGGISEKRIFVDRSNLPRGFDAPLGPFCLPDTIGLDLQELYSKLKFGNFALSQYSLNLNGDPNGFIISNPKCVFCSASDATSVVPEFW